MQKLGHFFRAHKTLFVSISFLTAFAFGVAKATPPSSPYNAGATLDPQCVPGSSNCTVTMQWNTVTGGINYSGGRVGIGTATPSAPLDVVGEMRSNSLTVTGVTDTSNTIAAPTNLQGVIDYTDPGASYSAFGYTLDYRVYAYKTVNGSRIYSTTYTTLADPLTDDGSFSLYSVDLTWDAVSGADGYRVLIAYGGSADSDFASADRHYDTTTNSLVDNGCGTVCFSAGSSVTDDVIYSNTNTLTGNTDFTGTVTINGTTTATDTIIASGTLGVGNAPTLSSGPRMEWVPGRAAFRAGAAAGTEWNNSNIGDYSIGLGYAARASGYGSIAMGNNANASADNAVAFNGVSSAQGAVAFGGVASGNYAFNFGQSSRATGTAANAFGASTIAASDLSTVFGTYNVGGGDALNWIATDPLFEIGNGTFLARHDALLILKNGNTTLGGSITTNGNGTINGDLHVTGNFVCDGSCNPAGIVTSQWTTVTGGINYSGGKVGIGAATPKTALDIEGDGAILAIGTNGSGVVVPDLGGGTRLMWIPRMGAFRAGAALNDSWDSNKVGNYSIGLGYNVQANGNYGIAIGSNVFSTVDSAVVIGSSSNVSGIGAVVFGSSSSASGANATGLGFGADANGPSSVAIGNGTSQGNRSIAIGYGTVSRAFSDVAVGRYNVGGGTATADVDSIVFTDPLFEVGDGMRSLGIPNLTDNALTILQNGNVGINTATGITSTFQVNSPNLGKGYIAYTSGTNTVTGTGTQFTNNFKVGDSIISDSFAETHVITAITDDTHMTLADNWANTVSITTYRTSGDVRFLVKGNGYVGIANAAPTFLLDVGSSAITTGTAVAEFQNAGGTCDITPSVSGGITCSSDQTLKKNITVLADNSPWSFSTNITTDNTSTLDKIMALTPVNYNWNVEKDTDAKHAGFIAQEVQQIFPDLVSVNATTHLLSLNYAGLVPYTIEAIKEMNLKISSIDDLTKSNSWRDALVHWFADAGNGIKSLVVHNQICVDDQCLTKDDIRQLLQMERGAFGGGAVTPAPIEVDTTESQPSEPAHDEDQLQSPEVESPAITVPEDTQSPAL